MAKHLLQINWFFRISLQDFFINPSASLLQRWKTKTGRDSDSQRQCLTIFQQPVIKCGSVFSMEWKISLSLLFSPLMCKIRSLMVFFTGVFWNVGNILHRSATTFISLSGFIIERMSRRFQYWSKLQGHWYGYKCMYSSCVPALYKSRPQWLIRCFERWRINDL